MKTKIISIAILFVTLTANIFTVSSQNYSDHFFDRKYENNQVVSSTRYEMGYEGLYEKTQSVEYSYDEDGKLSKKETFSWNSKKESWIPQTRIEYTYSYLNNSYTAELYKWNSKKEEFEPSFEKASYQTDFSGNVVSLSFIKTNRQGKDIEILRWSKEIIYFAM
jgi:hypothetical protein